MRGSNPRPVSIAISESWGQETGGKPPEVFFSRVRAGTGVLTTCPNTTLIIRSEPKRRRSFGVGLLRRAFCFPARFPERGEKGKSFLPSFPTFHPDSLFSQLFGSVLSDRISIFPSKKKTREFKFGRRAVYFFSY